MTLIQKIFTIAVTSFATASASAVVSYSISPVTNKSKTTPKKESNLENIKKSIGGWDFSDWTLTGSDTDVWM